MAKHNEDDRIKARANLEKQILHDIDVLRKLLTGGYSEYRINLVSIGRLGYEFSEDMINELGSDPAFEGLDVWHRIAMRYEYDKKDGETTRTLIRDDPKNSRAGINMQLLDTMTMESHELKEKKKHKLHEYTTLKDLRELVERKDENPGLGEITYLAGRYDFSFKVKDEDGKKRDLNPDDPEDYKIIENIVMTSVYLENPEELNREDILGIMDDFKKKRAKIEEIIDEVSGNKDKGIPPKKWEDETVYLKRNRATNLIDSILGVVELGKAFEGYKGNVFLDVNEIDFTHTAFAKASKIDPRKIDALGDNDEIRYEVILANKINEIMGAEIIDPRLLNVPTVGPHNEYAMAVSELVTYDGEPLQNLIEEGKLGLDEIKKKAGKFGHVVFDMRGSSDKDAAMAMINAGKSIMFQGRRSRRHVRTAVAFPDENYSVCLPVEHDQFGLQHPQYSILDRMNDKEKQNFERAVKVIKYINDRLTEEGILPKEWSHERFEPVKPHAGEAPDYLLEKFNELSEAIRGKTEPTKEQPLKPAEQPKQPEKSGNGDIVINADNVGQIIAPKVEAGAQLIINPPAGHYERRHVSYEVEIPLNLEARIFAKRKVEEGSIRKIAEIDLNKTIPTYFSFDFNKIGKDQLPNFIKFITDKEGKNVYALYKSEHKKTGKKDCGLIIWDRATAEFKKRVSFVEAEPSSICSLNNEIYVSFVNLGEIEEPISLKRLSEKGKLLEDYKGVKIVKGVCAGKNKIFGANGKTLAEWNKGKKEDKPIQIGHYLSDISLFNDYIVVCRAQNDNKVVLYDSVNKRSFAYDSYNAAFDIVSTNQGILMATSDIKTARPAVMIFDNEDNLFRGRYESALNPESKFPQLNGGILTLKGLNLLDNLLLLYGTDDKIHVVDWKEPRLTEMKKEHPVVLDKTYLLRK